VSKAGSQVRNNSRNSKQQKGQFQPMVLLGSLSKFRRLVFGAVLLGCSARALTTQVQQITQITRRWVEKVVVGKKLCPWAKQASERTDGRFKVSVLPNLTATREVDTRALISAVIEEAREVSNVSGATTLMVFPKLSPDNFEGYLVVANAVERRLKLERLDKKIQLATFHPLYEFAETGKMAVENYTNRSPFPILHLLRVDDVSEAISQYQEQKGSTDNIWKGNIARLQALGLPGAQKLLQSVSVIDEDYEDEEKKRG